MGYTKYMTEDEKEQYIFHKIKWIKHFQIGMMFLTVLFGCLALKAYEIVDIVWMGLGFLFVSLVVFLLGGFLHLSKCSDLDVKYRKRFERQWKKKKNSRLM